MKCKCGRTMKWTLAGDFQQRPDRRVYHCPGCTLPRKQCTCPQAWDINEVAKPGWSPYGKSK